jgi:hypothetical protein
MYHLREGLKQIQIMEQLAHGGALAAGENQTVERLLQISLLANFKVLHAQSIQHGCMLDKGTLERKNPYAHFTSPVLP